MRHLPLIAISLLCTLSIGLEACDDRAGAGGAQTADSGAASSEPPDAAEPANALLPCNTLTTQGLPGSKLYGVPETAPPARGGTIADGTYVLVQAIFYGQALSAVDGEFRKIVVKGSQLETVVNASPDRSLKDVTSTATWSTQGTTMTTTQSCPTTRPPSKVPYTALDGDGGTPRFVLYSTANGATIGSVFEKQ